MERDDTKTRRHIEDYGCTVMHVAEENGFAPFAYSVGITKQTGEPEVIVIGLKREMAHFVVNEYNKRVREGERFNSGQRYSGFLDGFDVEAQDVPVSAYAEYFGQALEFYGGPNFRVLQLVYPTTAGVWPWSNEAPPSFRNLQPLLAHASKSRAT